MSEHEIESKVRELRQLQSLIEEAQEEAETIKDALKAFMGDSSELRAGEYKVVEARGKRQTRFYSPQTRNAGALRALQPEIDRPPLLRRMRKATYPNADQSNGYAAPRPTTREVAPIISDLPPKNKEDFTLSETMFTIEQIKEQFLFDFNAEDKRDIANTLRGNFTQEEAADMVIAIGEAIEKHAKEHPEEAGELEKWDTLTRILWHVKEAYVIGVLDGLVKAAAANRMGLEQLEALMREEAKA